MSGAPTTVVTGAAGFIGSHVTRHLRDAGHDVVEVGRRCAIDSITVASLAGVDRPIALIVDCGGGSSVQRSIHEPLTDFHDTVIPLTQVLEFIRTRSSQTRLVFLSSAAVYGNTRALPIGEDCAPAPISPYGHHKRIGEELCRSYAQSYGVRVAILRLFSVYGPALQKQLWWDACRKAQAGVARFSGSGEELRDWLHVSDAASLILAAAGNASADVPVLNGGSGVGTSVADVVRRLFAQLGSALAPEFDGAGRAGDPVSFVADVRRGAALGWRPRVELDRGIVEYARWFREHA